MEERPPRPGSAAITVGFRPRLLADSLLSHAHRRMPPITSIDTAATGTWDPGSSTLAQTGPSALVVGISGASHNATVAACIGGALVAVCEQERLTRLRRAGLQPGTLPTEALAAVLRLAGDRVVTDVRQFATAEETMVLPSHVPALRFEHHFAHAATAYYLSPFESATTLVCDHSIPGTTIWSCGAGLTGIDWPCGSTSLTSLYSACARLFGFPPGQEHHLEALARLDKETGECRFSEVIRYEDGVPWASTRWRAVVTNWLAEGTDVAHRARVAGAFQRHLGRILLALVSDIRAATSSSRLCVGGGLFYNTYFTTLIQQSQCFDEVFVAPNPGNAGVAVGVALAASGAASHRNGAVSPFLGPEYDLEEIKATLDNCKLSYECLSEAHIIDETVGALQKGQLVGWFQGRMEWAHRALGNRSILANPLSPYVLDNLNVFLKRRERHRAYGLSVPEECAPRLFEGPAASRFMEYEYRLLDRDTLKHVLPENTTALRVQTLPDEGAFRRFRLVHQAFGQISGTPVLVNTSFNAFSEPIVCSPHDAIRAFFGTGLDLLVMDRFVVRK
jgi:carbamoyltransferase